MKMKQKVGEKNRWLWILLRLILLVLLAWTLIVLLNASSLKFGAFAIPSQRLMHLLLTVRKWLDNDSVLSEFSPHHRTRITMQLAQLFTNLAESTQDVSGGQWQFFLERSYEWIAVRHHVSFLKGDGSHTF